MIDSDSPKDLSHLSSAHNDSEAFGAGARTNDHPPTFQAGPNPFEGVVGILASDLEAWDEHNGKYDDSVEPSSDRTLMDDAEAATTTDDTATAHSGSSSSAGFASEHSAPTDDSSAAFDFDHDDAAHFGGDDTPGADSNVVPDHFG